MSGSLRSRITVGLTTLMLAAPAAVLLPATPALAFVVVNGTGTHWSPSSVTIAHGVSIHWHAKLGNHILKAYGGNWSFFHTLNQGATVSRTFFTRGIFHFYCTIHGRLVNGVCSGMCGKIIVT